MKKIILIAVLFVGFMGAQNAQNARLDTLFREYSSDSHDFANFFTYVYSTSEKEKSVPVPNTNTFQTVKVKEYNYMLMCNKKTPHGVKEEFLDILRGIIQKEKLELISKNKSGSDQLEHYVYNGDNEKGELNIIKSGSDLRVLWTWEVPLKKK